MFLPWLILVGSTSLAKPPFVFVQASGRVDHWSDWGEQLQKKLSDCGFAVETISPTSDKDLQTKLDASKAPAQAPVIFLAHGTDDFRFDGDYLLDGEKTKQSLLKRFDRSSLYFETCHSGFCLLDPSCPVGTACSAVQESYIHNQVSPMLVDLYCDSIDRCTTFSTFDLNGDGAVDGDEINRYLIKTYGKAVPVEFYRESFSRTDQDALPIEDLKKAIAKCKKSGATDDRITWVQSCTVHFNRQTMGRDTESTNKEYFKFAPPITGHPPNMPADCVLPGTKDTMKSIVPSDLPLKNVDVAKKTIIFANDDRSETFTLNHAKLHNIKLTCSTATDAATLPNKYRLPSNPNEDLPSQNPFFNKSFRIACAKPPKRNRGRESGLQFREREMREEPTH